MGFILNFLRRKTFRKNFLKTRKCQFQHNQQLVNHQEVMENFKMACLISVEIAVHVAKHHAALACLAIGGLPMFLCVCYQRGMLRTHQGIEGGVCGDLIGSYLCPCCVLTQMERETKD